METNPGFSTGNEGASSTSSNVRVNQSSGTRSDDAPSSVELMQIAHASPTSAAAGLSVFLSMMLYDKVRSTEQILAGGPAPRASAGVTLPNFSVGDTPSRGDEKSYLMILKFLDDINIPGPILRRRGRAWKRSALPKTRGALGGLERPLAQAGGAALPDGAPVPEAMYARILPDGSVKSLGTSKHRRTWTEDERSKLLNLKKMGFSNKQVALRLRRSKNSVSTMHSLLTSRAAHRRNTFRGDAGGE
eukprot:gnl/Chilomastix_cuspidata/2149.p1 GENE.gnl/Chilomastix_cuspidata/2149~~gnl/Chilomastix_cuspidata/2149.p1  ORF type:complete len:246 (+),score=40.51 gnl/Chilomastix_cuspidata/2149:104-841(+)